MPVQQSSETRPGTKKLGRILWVVALVVCLVAMVVSATVAVFHFADEPFWKLTPGALAVLCGMGAWFLSVKIWKESDFYQNSLWSVPNKYTAAAIRKRQPFGGPTINRLTREEIRQVEALKAAVAEECAGTDAAILASRVSQEWGKHSERMMCRDGLARTMDKKKRPLQTAEIAKVEEYECPVPWYPQEDWEVLCRHLRAKARYRGEHFNPTHLRSTPRPKSFELLMPQQQTELLGQFEALQDWIASIVKKEEDEKTAAAEKANRDARWGAARERLQHTAA